MTDIKIFFQHPLWHLLLPFTQKELLMIIKSMKKEFLLHEPDIPNLEIYIVGDAEMSKMNLSRMKLAGPTNILSFPGNGKLPATLLVSLDTVKRESLLYGQNPAEYLIFLLAHGFGHLAGHDHGNEHSALSSACYNAAAKLHNGAIN